MNGTSAYGAKRSSSSSQMRKSAAGRKAWPKRTSVGDDTHADRRAQNDVSEQEQRWAGHREHISVSELRQKVSQEHAMLKEKPGAPCRPGGIFGLERNHINKVPMGRSYVAQMEGHSSQAETVVRTGRRLGVQKEQVDKLTVGLKSKDHAENRVRRRDAVSACPKGLGRMFSMQKLKEKVDRAPERKNHGGEVEKAESQRESPRMFGAENEKVAADRNDTGISKKQKPQKEHVGVSVPNAGAAALRTEFENLVRTLDEDSRRRVEEDRARRKRKEQQQQTQTGRKVERQRTPLVLNSGKTPAAFAVLHQVTHEEPLTQKQQMTGSPGPAAGHPEHSSEEDGEYEDMGKAPVQADESDYEDLTRRTSAVAMYSYRGEDEDEISFSVSDVITNIEMASEAWWRGYCHGRFGYFPACFVQVFQCSTTRIN
ncbi:hematopoietic lineage cell-specific protein-like isoform X3 [Scleropages formosus]|uniref:Hematopoietic lineage cell-specific protein-like n=1 Tax=Scleropages formosus TaxID=113540 RepID=A0A8C9RAQ6_SCLFO|nr:hematopoietic lineage cell-specific protein-like isoform X3 [Scleropages formosus]